MRKIIAIYLIFSIALWMSAPVRMLADEGATTTEPVLGASALAPEASTTIADPSAAPLVKADDTATATEKIITAGENIATTTKEVIATSTEVFATATEEIATTTESVFSVAGGAAGATMTDEVATSTAETAATTTIENANATTVIDIATSTIEDATGTEGQRDVLPKAGNVGGGTVMAVWQMAEDGLNDGSAAVAQFEPSGQYRVSKKIKICGAVGGDVSKLEGVYGQMFYPQNAAFGHNDAQGRQGCGQVAAPACKMEKLLSESNQTASVYCCDQELAYDDVAGDYSAAVMAKDIDGGYSNMLTTKFTYLPLSKISIDFNNVYYGTVQQGVEAVANETVTNATVRNVGNTPARVSLWQDDMGLGQTDGADNIRYGARLSRVDASWVNYGPFETIVMPDALAPGQSVDMDFSVKVLNFPKFDDDELRLAGASGEGGLKTEYSGQMKIDAVPAIDINYECAAQLLATASQVVPNDKPIAKPEVESTDATTTPPI